MAGVCEAQSLWWDTIVGPARLVRRVAELLLVDRTSALLLSPRPLPWQAQFTASVEMALRELNNQLLVEVVDWEEEGASDVGTWLLERYADSDVRSHYRPGSGRTLGVYLREKGILARQVLWVRGLEGTALAAWRRFCREFHSGGIADGLFLLESWENPQPSSTELRAVDCGAFITSYDSLLFNSLLAGERDLPPLWKQYAAAVATALCGDDVELSSAFLEEADPVREDPLDVLAAMAGRPEWADRLLDPGHPLTLAGEGEFQPLRERVWEAQLKVAYTLCETERLAFIRRDEEPIRQILSVPGGFCQDQKGTPVTDPFELDFGSLYYLSGPNGNWRLRLSEQDRTRLKHLRWCRNRFAHMHPCTPRELESLFCPEIPPMP